MKNFKGTKGEWTVQWSPLYKKEPKKICEGVGVSQQISGTGTYTTMICNPILPKTDKEYLEQKELIEADMKLIASSKKLLEALIQLLYDNTGEAQDKPNGGYLTSAECVIRARKAINEAL